MEKTCTKCGALKPLDAFHRFNASRDGHRTECKDCACARARAKYDPSKSDTGLVKGVCSYEPCGGQFEYVKTTGRRRMYCSERCKFRGGDQMKKNRSAASTRCCPCGSTDVARVGVPVCPACRKDPRDNANNYARERRRILRRYNLTQADWDAMVLRQGNRCAICNTERPGGRGEAWHIDHDHLCCPDAGSCGACVRGLLCHDCNTVLGRMNDDPVRLRSAAAYLERSRQPHLFVVA
jgi:hypothetical protein